MTINENCIRDILKYLVENLEITIETHNRFTYCNISVYRLIEELYPSKYTKEDIVYSVNILANLSFIEGEQLSDKVNVSCSFQTINNVTYRGQKFYECIKPEPIWNKTKNIVSKVGVHTLEFIERIAHDVIVESAKEATSIVLNKNIK